MKDWLKQKLAHPFILPYQRLLKNSSRIKQWLLIFQSISAKPQVKWWKNNEMDMKELTIEISEFSASLFSILSKNDLFRWHEALQ